MTYSIPFYAHTTGRFGDFESWRSNPHRGHDVAPPGGGAFPSWTPGVVAQVYSHSCLGRVVVVRNDDGAYIGVSHLDSTSVSVGQRVSIGTRLGYIGNTGDCTTGRHAHITVSWSSARPESGSVVDPVQYANNAVPNGGTGGVDYAYGLTKDAQLKLQGAMAKEKRYSGAIDGKFGSASVKGMQQWLRDMGYLVASYVVDGVPGRLYGEGLQKLAAAKGGYTGKIDGIPGPATSAGLIKWADLVLAVDTGSSAGYGYGLSMEAQRQIQAALKHLQLYTGVVDGVFGPASVASMQTYLKKKGLLPTTYGVDGNPGVLYGKALQELAQDYGYTGAIDGIPGDLTSGALIKWSAAMIGGTTPTTPPPIPTPEERWPSTGTFGIDVASPQRDIDFARARADGAKFAIVKMGGLNVTPQYVAPYYVAMIGRARAAGLKIGHYYLVGLGQSPEAQAKFFVDNLHDFRKDEDVLAFDNEKLDANGVQWGDEEAARFMLEVFRLSGIWPERGWHYGGAHAYRALKPWPKTEATKCRFWWAAYDDNDEVREHEPDLQGSISDWDVHQFSSTVSIAGYKLDGNWSPHTLEVLFAKGTVTEPEPPVEPEEPEVPEDCKTDELLAELAGVIAKYATA